MAATPPWTMSRARSILATTPTWWARTSRLVPRTAMSSPSFCCSVKWTPTMERQSSKRTSMRTRCSTRRIRRTWPVRRPTCTQAAARCTATVRRAGQATALVRAAAPPITRPGSRTWDLTLILTMETSCASMGMPRATPSVAASAAVRRILRSSRCLPRSVGQAVALSAIPWTFAWAPCGCSWR